MGSGRRKTEGAARAPIRRVSDSRLRIAAVAARPRGRPSGREHSSAPRRHGAQGAPRQPAKSRAPRQQRRRRKARAASREQALGEWRRQAPARSSAGCVYWGIVLGLWGVIAAVGVFVWIAAHLPPIQSLEVPKRPPAVQILGAQRAHARHARRHGRRRGRAQGPAASSAAGLSRDRGSPLLSASRHRPDRRGARDRRQPVAARRVAGRLHPDAAARQEPVPDPSSARSIASSRSSSSRCGSSTSSPRPRSSISTSTASTSVPAPTGSRRRRSATSASRHAR